MASIVDGIGWTIKQHGAPGFPVFKQHLGPLMEQVSSRRLTPIPTLEKVNSHSHPREG
jgi:hypothetical protein